MDVPNFRYMQDAQRFLKDLSAEVDESRRLLKVQQKALGASLASIRVTAADEVFNLSPSSEKDQRSLLRKLRHNVDPQLDKVVVPNLKKLQSQYALAEDFYEKLKALEQAETQVQMAFHERKGPEYTALMTSFRSLKTKIQDGLRECLQFLADVAQKHVPPGFQKYIDMVVEQINEHVIFRDSSTFLYVSADNEGSLVFTAYIMLQDVANDEGSLAPHLYISVQWVLGKENVVRVDLNHEYEVPNKLLGQGDPVGSVGEAAKAINDLLELENYSSTLGVVPLAIQMNVDPTTIKISEFQYGDVVQKLEVGEHTMTFFLRKEIKEANAVTEIAAQIYKELKARLKRGQVRLTMKTERQGNQTVLTFTIIKVAEGGEVSDFDVEFMRSRFGLNNAQVRKIVNIING